MLLYHRECQTKIAKENRVCLVQRTRGFSWFWRRPSASRIPHRWISCYARDSLLIFTNDRASPVVSSRASFVRIACHRPVLHTRSCPTYQRLAKSWRIARVWRKLPPVGKTAIFAMAKHTSVCIRSHIFEPTFLFHQNFSTLRYNDKKS